jgi:hypothetical protein
MLKNIRMIKVGNRLDYKANAKNKNGSLKIGILLLCCFLLTIILPYGGQSAEKNATSSQLAAPTGLRIVNTNDIAPNARESENNAENQASPNDSAETESTYQQLDPPKNLKIVIEY